jgi:hypothetical protein
MKKLASFAALTLAAFSFSACSTTTTTPSPEPEFFPAPIGEIAPAAPVAPPAPTVIGRWQDPESGGIYRMMSDLTLETSFRDSGPLTMKLRATGVERGRRFDPVPPRPNHVYFLLLRSDQMEVWDKQGYVTTMAPLK